MCKFHEVLADRIGAAAPAGLDRTEVAATAQVAATLYRVQMYLPALNGISGHNPDQLTNPAVTEQFQISRLPKAQPEIDAVEGPAVTELATNIIPRIFSALGLSAGSSQLPSCPTARGKLLDNAADTFFDGDTHKMLTIKANAPQQRTALLFEAVTALLADPYARRILPRLFEGSVAKLILAAPADSAAMKRAGIDPASIAPACHMGGNVQPAV